MPQWREKIIFQSNVIAKTLRKKKLRCKTQSIPLSWTACISNQPASIAASFFSSLAQAAMIQQLKHWAHKASFWLRLAIQRKTNSSRSLNYSMVLMKHTGNGPEFFVSKNSVSTYPRRLLKCRLRLAVATSVWAMIGFMKAYRLWLAELKATLGVNTYPRRLFQLSSTASQNLANLIGWRWSRMFPASCWTRIFPNFCVISPRTGGHPFPTMACIAPRASHGQRRQL